MKFQNDRIDDEYINGIPRAQTDPHGLGDDLFYNILEAAKPDQKYWRSHMPDFDEKLNQSRPYESVISITNNKAKHIFVDKKNGYAKVSILKNGCDIRDMEPTTEEYYTNVFNMAINLMIKM